MQVSPQACSQGHGLILGVVAFFFQIVNGDSVALVEQATVNIGGNVR